MFKKKLNSKSKEASIMYLLMVKASLEEDIQELEKIGSNTYLTEQDIKCIDETIEYLEKHC